ncbi:MAG: hypothetical protein COC05_06510 [Gammaproteobacteria bacterium]|nr:MAG: hypothetical protein COC05_06510 [Gammaproteobacteria bacterium]
MEKLNKLPLIVIVMTLVSSCTGDSAKFTAPLMSQCEEAVVAHFEKTTSEDSDIHYDIEYFSDVIPSHPEVIGVVNIYSDADPNTYIDIEPIEYLHWLWNSPLHDCYPTESIEIDLTQDITSSGILRKIYFGNKQPKDYYIAFKDEVMTVWSVDHNDRVRISNSALKKMLEEQE